MKAKNDIVAEAMPQPTLGDLAEENETLKGGLQALKMIALEQIEEIESLKESREAWVRKCEELTGQLEEADAEVLRLKDYAADWIEEWRAAYNHPLQCLWQNIKAVLGFE